jgi:hypothetical protein
MNFSSKKRYHSIASVLALFSLVIISMIYLWNIANVTEKLQPCTTTKDSAVNSTNTLIATMMMEDPKFVGNCQTVWYAGGKGQSDRLHSERSGIDGEWAVCMDNLRTPFRHSNCTVYSFGIRDDWSFDQTMATACNVYSFDPSIHMERHKHSERDLFIPWGLGDDNWMIEKGGKEVWEMHTLDYIMDTLGHKTLDVLKIDVEGFEWTSVIQMIESNTLQKRVKQITMEMHLFKFAEAERFDIMYPKCGNDNSFLSLLRRMYSCYPVTSTTPEDINFWLSVFERMREAGFMMVASHVNENGRKVKLDESFVHFRAHCCYEITWVNTQF